MKNRKIKCVQSILSLILLVIYPSVLLASTETIELPGACKKKLAGYSSKRLATLAFNAEKSASRLAETKKRVT